MALDAHIVGTNLDTDGNIKVALPLTPAKIGGVRLFSENDLRFFFGIFFQSDRPSEKE